MTGIRDLQTMFGATSGAQGAEKSAMSAKAATVTDRALTGGDQSVVSSTAGALVQAASTSDVRADKVAQLKAAIDSGSYSVPSSDVAEKLLGNMMGGR